MSITKSIKAFLVAIIVVSLLVTQTQFAQAVTSEEIANITAQISYIQQLMAKLGFAQVAGVSTSDVVYELSGDTTNVVNVPHTSALSIPEGTITFSFNATNINSRGGLLTKDASGYGGGGNHFAAYIYKGKLNIRFQDTDSDATF